MPKYTAGVKTVHSYPAEIGTKMCKKNLFSYMDFVFANNNKFYGLMCQTLTQT